MTKLLLLLLKAFILTAAIAGLAQIKTFTSNDSLKQFLTQPNADLEKQVFIVINDNNNNNQNIPCPSGSSYNLDSWVHFLIQPRNKTIIDEFENWSNECAFQISKINFLITYINNPKERIYSLEAFKYILPKFFNVESYTFSLINAGLISLEGMQYFSPKNVMDSFFISLNDNNITDIIPLQQFLSKLNNKSFCQILLDLSRNQIMSVDSFLSNITLKSGCSRILILNFSQNRIISAVSFLKNSTFISVLQSQPMVTINLSQNFIEYFDLNLTLDSFKYGGEFQLDLHDNQLVQIKYDLNQPNCFNLQQNINLSGNQLNDVSFLLKNNSLSKTSILYLSLQNNQLTSCNFFCDKNLQPNIKELYLDFRYNKLRNISKFLDQFTKLENLFVYFAQNMIEQGTFCQNCDNIPLKQIFIDFQQNKLSTVDQIFEELKICKNLTNLNLNFNENSLKHIGRSFDQYFSQQNSLNNVYVNLKKNQIQVDEQDYFKYIFIDLQAKGVQAFIEF